MGRVTGPRTAPQGRAPLSAFLPTTPEEMTARGWDRPDFLLVSGDAYVDHSSFGPAVVGRFLESLGFRVALAAPTGLAAPRSPSPSWAAPGWRRW